MIDVVLIFNGLGNQMSQYAFYLAKKKHSQFTLPVFYNNIGLSHNGYELKRVFGIDASSNIFIQSIFRFLFIKYMQKGKVFSLTRSFCHLILEKEDYSYEKLKLWDNGKGITYYWGGWHSEKYFSDIEDELRKVFVFDDNKLNTKSSEWAETIKKTKNSCFIHVRRGDYLSHPYFNNVATESYYSKAIEMITQLCGEQEFFVFSDDIEWCKSNWGNGHFHYIDCNKKNDSWQDMYLMSLCQNHINANSTFSWWGAWLGNKGKSVTIVPSRFTTQCETPDFYPENWIKL